MDLSLVQLKDHPQVNQTAHPQERIWMAMECLHLLQEKVNMTLSMQTQQVTIWELPPTVVVMMPLQWLTVLQVQDQIRFSERMDQQEDHPKVNQEAPLQVRWAANQSLAQAHLRQIWDQIKWVRIQWLAKWLKWTLEQQVQCQPYAPRHRCYGR